MRPGRRRCHQRQRHYRADPRGIQGEFEFRRRACYVSWRSSRGVCTLVQRISALGPLFAPIFASVRPRVFTILSANTPRLPLTRTTLFASTARTRPRHRPPCPPRAPRRVARRAGAQRRPARRAGRAAQTARLRLGSWRPSRWLRLRSCCEGESGRKRAHARCERTWCGFRSGQCFMIPLPCCIFARVGVFTLHTRFWLLFTLSMLGSIRGEPSYYTWHRGFRSFFGFHSPTLLYLWFRV